MKQSLAFFPLILLFSRPVLAYHIDLGQFHDGQAKPRAEVAWIWMKGDGLHVARIDHSRFKEETAVVEVLPGKHVLEAYYWNGGAFGPGKTRKWRLMQRLVKTTFSMTVTAEVNGTLTLAPTVPRQKI